METRFSFEPHTVGARVSFSVFHQTEGPKLPVYGFMKLIGSPFFINNDGKSVQVLAGHSMFARCTVHVHSVGWLWSLGEQGRSAEQVPVCAYVGSSENLQGYLAHKKAPPPRILQQGCA